MGQSYFFGVVLREFVVLLAFAAPFAMLLHSTAWDRRIYAIGNNPETARFSGIAVRPLPTGAVHADGGDGRTSRLPVDGTDRQYLPENRNRLRAGDHHDGAPGRRQHR